MINPVPKLARTERLDADLRHLGGKRFPIAGLASLSPSRLLLLACLGIVIVHLGAGALTLLHNYTTIRVGQKMVNGLRGALYAHLQRLSLHFKV